MKYKVSLDLELRHNPYKGKYIALEGTEGSGKTTQAEILAKHFREQGHEVVVTREPRKSGLIGDLVRDVLQGKQKLPPVAFQYLFSADRAAHQEELIIPSLKRGKVVITDRCFWSAIVYGIVDRADDYSRKSLDLLMVTQSILSMYHQFIVPDKTFYLQIGLKTSLKRIAGKKEAKEVYEKESVIKKVIKGYDFVHQEFPKEIQVIDGEQETEKVTQALLSAIKA